MGFLEKLPEYEIIEISNLAELKRGVSQIDGMITRNIEEGSKTLIHAFVTGKSITWKDSLYLKFNKGAVRGK